MADAREFLYSQTGEWSAKGFPLKSNHLDYDVYVRSQFCSKHIYEKKLHFCFLFQVHSVTHCGCHSRLASLACGGKVVHPEAYVVVIIVIVVIFVIVVVVVKLPVWQPGWMGCWDVVFLGGRDVGWAGWVDLMGGMVNDSHSSLAVAGARGQRPLHRI